MNNILAKNLISGKEPSAVGAAGNDIPYVPESKQVRFDLRENGRVLLVGGGLVLILLIFAFSGISRRQPARQSSSQKKSVDLTANAERPSEVSLTPILDIGPSAGDNSITNATSADQVLRTAKEKPIPSRPATLANVPPIEDRSWQPPPYSAQLNRTPGTAQDNALEMEPNKSARSVPPDSLIFVAKPGSVAERSSAPPVFSPDLFFHLAPGTRLRARLESELNSAVKSPVVAILEDNYQENGVVILPAGSRAIGRLVNADKSGYIEVHFDSLDLPSGSSLQLEAVATDLQLRPLRGRVEGKGTGRNLLLRSAAGIGQMAATLVGRGSLNQPLSEEDMLRERLSNNIGQAGDQELAATALSQRFVVSLGAGAEIYLVVEKGSTEKIAPKNSPGGAVDQHSLDQLRQLLQLERELNASTAAQ